MKHTGILTLTGLLALALPTLSAETKQLPAPDIKGGIPLMQAIDQRHSERSYDPERRIDDQTLSEILWVAWGMNSGGKRTIATARNLQNMGLYLLTPEGTWRYEAATNTLVKVNDKNLIPLTARQSFVNDAPVHLLFTAKDDTWGRCHVGSAYQNVYLYATSKGLATVVRGLIDTDALTRELAGELKDGEVVIIHQTVGWPIDDED
ncbi:MAG TPA: nitroreductase family protein [Candidatus Akkermansia intestinigallinarum]|uniref:Nitroreductase family protein n=1 Tax=Candidatus Akkermansia intestinigallinarum TaxID=2838431 RepID=A0A9D1VAF1_9BACT|nr:nitroreductase family protein [Candidatus Akkermansia intestinigallinarum]